MPRRMTLPALLFLTTCTAPLYAEPPAPLPSAHAHNDYLHQRPLVDALERGFTSVEADIFLVDGNLLVGHERDAVKPEATLEALYLAPLAKRVQQHGGRVYPTGERFFLLIDIKSDPQPTYARLEKALAAHADMLTTVAAGNVRPAAVTVVITGNRPRAELLEADPRYAGLDGRPSDLASDAPSHFMPMISDRWSAHFTWTGHGPMPAAEEAKLKAIVEQAHAADRVVRFWATPENESVWKQLRTSGVDLINTDKLDRLAAFLSKEKGNHSAE
jgi:hypothetical protein